jgi:hypothetical protein
MTRYPPLLLVVAALLISPGLYGSISSGDRLWAVVFGVAIAFLLGTALRIALTRR